jgi:hypothetical protein
MCNRRCSGRWISCGRRKAHAFSLGDGFGCLGGAGNAISSRPRSPAIGAHIVHPAAARISGACLGLRLRRRQHPRRPEVPHPDDHRRGQPRMHGTRGGTALPSRRRTGGVGGDVHRTRATSKYQVRQRQRVYRDCGAEMAGEGRREDALNHAGVALGERLQRKLQWIARRRAPRR